MPLQYPISLSISMSKRCPLFNSLGLDKLVPGSEVLNPFLHLLENHVHGLQKPRAFRHIVTRGINRDLLH